MSDDPQGSSAGRAPSFPVKLGRAKPEARKVVTLEVIRRTGLPPRQAALSVGISSSAFYRLLDGDRDFMDAIEGATAVFARRMAASIAAAAARGSWRAAAFWLERRLGDAYGQRLDVKVEATLEDRIDAALSDDELQRHALELADEVQRRFGANR